MHVSSAPLLSSPSHLSPSLSLPGALSHLLLAAESRLAAGGRRRARQGERRGLRGFPPRSSKSTDTLADRAGARIMPTENFEGRVGGIIVDLSTEVSPVYKSLTVTERD